MCIAILIEKWRNDSWVASFDISVHWGRNADVPVHFFYFDDIEFGHDPGSWWTQADPRVLEVYSLSCLFVLLVVALHRLIGGVILTSSS